MELTLIKKVKLTLKIKKRHYEGIGELPSPVALQIVRYGDDAGCYLLYLDERGEEITDVYHETVEQAMEQAEREFEVKPGSWEQG